MSRSRKRIIVGVQVHCQHICPLTMVFCFSLSNESELINLSWRLVLIFLSNRTNMSISESFMTDYSKHQEQFELAIRKMKEKSFDKDKIKEFSELILHECT